MTDDVTVSLQVAAVACAVVTNRAVIERPAAHTCVLGWLGWLRAVARCLTARAGKGVLANGADAHGVVLLGEGASSALPRCMNSPACKDGDEEQA